MIIKYNSGCKLICFGGKIASSINNDLKIVGSNMVKNVRMYCGTISPI
jgi:hypothetical protein